ncbi:MAG: hypothetical protein KGL95_12525 [Patescibacteria group bacterium]|nr:hypothetical protein [Patescibacteria group bacterium]
MTGPDHPLFGTTRPQHVKDASSAANLGRSPPNKGQKGLHKDSPETKIKKSLAAKGKKKSEDHRKNIALAKLGPKNPQYGKIPWNFGIPCAPGTIEKIREARLFQEISQDTKPEKLLHAELEKRGIEFQKNIYIDGRPDIFILPNVCIFVDGDFHHANPSKYKPNDRIFEIQIVEEIWKRDKEVTDWLLEMGFKVMRFWQSEIEKDVALCVDMFLSGNFVTVIKKDGTREHIPVNDKT